MTIRYSARSAARGSATAASAKSTRKAAKSKKSGAKKTKASSTKTKAPSTTNKTSSTNAKPAKAASTDPSGFAVGDRAVYPAQGVAEVVGVERKEISGVVIEFYVLKIMDTEMKIMVPVHKATQVGLRRLATAKDIKEVMKILKEKDVKLDKQTWNRRYRGFMEKIKTGSLFDVAEVYRDLSRLKHTKALSFGEKRMLDTARNLIVKELSVAQDKPFEKVESQLEKLFA